MKKTSITILCLAACFATADTKITWLADVTADRAETVTGVQSGQVANAAAHIVRTDNPHGVTAPQIGAITVELDPVANAALVVHTNRIDNPHGVTAPQIGALTAELDPVANAALVVHTNRTDNPHGVTAQQIGALTTELDPVANAALTVHTNRIDNPHGVTAAQIGAITAEADEAALAALAAYAAYWPPNATASSWFTFTTNANEITIMGYNIDGGTAVIIPDYINGLPVTEIGADAFAGSGVTSISGAGNVVTVGDAAFNGCPSLASVSLPQVQAVGDSAFRFCPSLTSVSLPQVQTVGGSAFRTCISLASVSMPQVLTVGDSAFDDCPFLTSLYFDNDAPAIGADIFTEITPNQVTNYVTNPQATGWGATLASMPVVRLPLYADAIYQAGELVATTGHVAQASLADADGYTTQMVMRVGSEITTNIWGPRVTLPDGIVTNGMSGVEIRNTTINGIFKITPPNIGVPFWYMNRFDGANLFAFQQVYNAGSWDLELLRFTGYGPKSSIYFGQSGAIGINYTDPSYALDVRVPADFITPVVSPLRLSSSDGNQLFVVSGDGDVTAIGTNTAAEVRSLGGYSIFDSGSNCYWRVTASNGTFYASDTNGVRKFKFTTETPYTAWTGTITPANGTATVTIAHGNMPVLVADAPCVLTLDPTGYGTAGVSRVSLSYYTGTHSFTFATNIIKYAETPTVDTSGWNTLLIRRVSNGAWKGVGL